MSNKILCTVVFTGKQPQASWRGTRQGPIWLSSKLHGQLSNGAIEVPFRSHRAVYRILFDNKTFLDRSEHTTDQLDEKAIAQGYQAPAQRPHIWGRKVEGIRDWSIW